MKELGLVSIITPAYNSERFIADMIESVIAQSYTNWELLITDDCSKDSTATIVKEYSEKDSRIKYFCLPCNSGAGVARNNSIKIANGRYIAFLDSDDMWDPKKLELQLSFMDRKQCGMSYSSNLTIDVNGEVIGVEIAPKSQTFCQCKNDNRIGCLTIIYDADKVGKVYMPELRKRQDWGLVLNVLKKCGIAYGMKQPLAYYRKGQDSLSKNKLSLVKYNIALYQEVLGWTYFFSLVYFCFVYLPCWSYKKWLTSQYNK